jgi:hypothetical protein
MFSETRVPTGPRMYKQKNSAIKEIEIGMFVGLDFIQSSSSCSLRLTEALSLEAMGPVEGIQAGASCGNFHLNGIKEIRVGTGQERDYPNDGAARQRPESFFQVA